MAGLLASAVIEDPVTALLNLIVPAVSLVVFEFCFRRSSEAALARRAAHAAPAEAD